MITLHISTYGYIVYYYVYKFSKPFGMLRNISLKKKKKWIISYKTSNENYKNITLQSYSTTCNRFLIVSVPNSL